MVVFIIINPIAVALIWLRVWLHTKRPHMLFSQVHYLWYSPGNSRLANIVMKTSIKHLVIVSIISLLSFTTAYAYQLSVIVDGSSYSCNTNNDGNNRTLCMQSVSDFCYRITSYNKDTCFQKSSAYCPSSNFASCVEQSEEYCYRNTSHNHDRCFDLSLGLCRGNFKNIEELFEEVRLRQLLLDQGINAELNKASQPTKKK